VYPCGAIGVGVGAAFLAEGGPPGPTPIAVDVQLPLYSAPEVCFSAMVSSPFDPAPHYREHSCSSTDNAASERMIRHIPHVFGGKPEKSP